MEQRTAKVIIGTAGGTAAKNSRTYKLALPTTWVEKMGISQTQRELELSFDGETITLSRRLSGQDFAEQKRASGHDVRILHFYNNSVLCSTLYADFTEQTLIVENEEVSFLKTAFGNNLHPTWEDFQQFLEERCIPRQRAGLREYLEALDLEEYDPLAMIEKTEGRMAEDQQRLTIEVLE